MNPVRLCKLVCHKFDRNNKIEIENDFDDLNYN